MNEAMNSCTEIRNRSEDYMAFLDVIGDANMLIRLVKPLQNLGLIHGLDLLAQRLYTKHSSAGSDPSFTDVIQRLQRYISIEYIPEIISEVEKAKETLERLAGVIH